MKAAIQTLLGGATPITRVSTVDVMPGMESGQPIVGVGTMAYRSNLRVISTEENPIESAADMEGKVIGLGSVGGTSEKMLNFALDEAGVDRDSVTTQSNLENPERVEEIELFLAAIKEATQEIIDDSENDFANVLATLRDSGDWDFAALTDDAIAVEALKTYTTETWIDSTGTVGLLENDEDFWTTIYDSYVAGGLLEGGADPSAWITSDLLPAN